MSRALRAWAGRAWSGWERFWFTPADPVSLGLVRVFTGAMLLYTHLVWTIDLEAFFGEAGFIPPDTLALLRGDSYAWSYLSWVGSSRALWALHLAALVVFAMLTIGLASRVVSVLAWIAALSYAMRAPSAMFGLDQINVLLAMYLAVGPSGDALSLDSLIARRRTGRLPRPSTGANVAIRLIELHMCVIYAFAGASKLMGPSWWDGTAMWRVVANLEYQSIDMTWLADWPRLINVATYITVAWELGYAALIWPRATRPLMLLFAIPIHLGIAACFGMATFGLVMLVGNLAFVPPEWVRAAGSSLRERLRRSGPDREGANADQVALR
jgi:hypothetical protein